MSDISHTQIMSYQQDWHDIFQEEQELIKQVFGDNAIEIEHIGSTSVVGLEAKPIIDIAVLIEKSMDADAFVVPLEKIRYRYDKRNSSAERYFFRKGKPTKFHLSICYLDKGTFWKRQILFRDYLRGHEDARYEYAKLKNNLLKKDPTGKGEYIYGKSDFIARILNQAEQES